MKVLNRPKTEYLWEFEVVRATNKENVYSHIGFFENGFEAEEKAIEYNGIVIHNIRIAHKKLIE